MRNISKTWIHHLIIIGLVLCLILIIRCAKEEDKDDNNPQLNTVTDIDGNVYHTVTIGTQTWMLENLTVIHYRNGDEIPNITDFNEWNELTTGAYANYNNDPNNSKTYGRLYNWHAVSDSRKITPAGWHVPADLEWQTLINYLGGDSIAGGKLKETGTEHWLSPNDSATNESGFTALPGGRYPTDSYEFLRMNASGSWWSSTAVIKIYYINNEPYYEKFITYGYTLFNTTHPFIPSLTGGAISRWEDPKELGFSVRCIKN